MKKRVLILGSSGLLGSRISSVFSECDEIEIFCTSRVPLDSSIKFDALSMSLDSLLNETRPDFIINCIAVIPQGKKRSFKNIWGMYKVNTKFARELSRIAHDREIRLIQPCTDGVFYGRRGGYSEKSLRIPNTLYGVTKLLGERRALNQINLRCSIVGQELPGNSKSIYSWVLSRPQNSKVDGYTNQFWNGVTTFVFAKFCKFIVLENPKLPPILHVTPADSVTKFELLKLISSCRHRSDIKVIPVANSKKRDFRLVSLHARSNLILWSGIGFPKPLTIQEMIALE